MSQLVGTPYPCLVPAKTAGWPLHVSTASPLTESMPSKQHASAICTISLVDMQLAFPPRLSCAMVQVMHQR